MPAHAPVKEDEPRNDLERDLAEEIARAMQRRPPLMNRLAEVGPAPAGATDHMPPLSITEESADPPHLNGATSAPIEQLMEELGEPVTTPASTAEWLGKARRERSRARLRNAAAWLATLIIGGSIISMTVLMLHP